MRIRELKLIRYGKFTDRRIELPDGEQDIHLIVGHNEAGKSTVRSAIGDWLFGIPARTTFAFLHPMPELRIGGEIEGIAGTDGERCALAFERTKGNKNTLRTLQDDPMQESILQAWLGGLDAAAFNRMYALDHPTLVEGGAGILSASDDLGRMLFQSASGMEHLGRLLQQLEKEADELWAPRKSATREYYAALDAFEQANEQLRQATLRARDWKARHEALNAGEQALNQARQRNAQIRADISRLERLRRVQPLLLTLDSGRQQLDELLAQGPAPLLPEDAATVLNQAKQAAALAEAEIQRHQAAIAEAQAELEKITVDHQLLSLAADINDLNERRLQYRAHRSDILKRQEELRLELQRASEKASGLGWAAGTAEEIAARVPPQGVRTRLNRLLKGRGALLNQQQNAAERLRQRQQEMALGQKSLDELGVDRANPRLKSAVDQAQKIGDLDAMRLEFAARAQQLDAAIEAALAELGRWRASPAALAAMSVPDPAVVQETLSEQRTDAAEAQSLHATLEAKTAECGRTKLELEQLVRTFQPVSSEQVNAARAHRDSCWAAIKAAPQELPSLSPDYERKVGEADDLADSRLDKLQHEAERQAKARHQELLEQEIATMQARRQSVLERISARNARWMALAEACGLPHMPPEQAPQWLAQRRKALDLLHERGEIERQRQARNDAAEAARQNLWAQIGTQSKDEDAPDLAECLRLAREQITLADQARGQRKTLESQLAEASAGLPQLKNAVQTADEAWQAWESSWQAGVSAAGYPADVPVDQLEAELEVIEEIDRLLGKVRAIQTERIDTMQADLDDFARTAQALAARLAPELAGKAAEEICLALFGRLDVARRKLEEWKNWQARHKKASGGLESACGTQRAVQAQLAPLLTAAGVDAEARLEPAITRSAQRRSLEKTIADAEAELHARGDGLSQADLRAELAAQDTARLVLELEELNQQAEAVLEQVSTLSKEHGAQKVAFDALNGADRAARAEAQKQEAVTRMSEAVERYLHTRTVASLLRWSMEKFRETQQGPMLAKASSIFKTLTLDSFSRLLVDASGEKPYLFGVRPDGQPVEVAGMSEGSRDQLYLALRLAALEIQIGQGFNMPLIADDLFINFDDRRTEAGLKVLGELSRRMQVIFLTHHEHLAPLAKEVLGDGLNLVSL